MDVFKGRLRATEGSYFKHEQEEKLQEYRRKRWASEKLTTDLSGVVSEPELGAVADKLAEISAAETRLSARPESRRFFGDSQFPPTSAAGSRRPPAWSTPLVSGPSAVGHAPRTSLGRNRWSLPSEADVVLLPEETAAQVARKAVAEKALAAGTRALLYGSAAAVMAVVLGARLALDSAGVSDEAGLRAACAQALAPAVQRLRAAAAPLTAADGWAGRLRLAGASLSRTEGEADGESFTANLRGTAAFRGVALPGAPSAAADEPRRRASDVL
jgi:hypothetical protein